MPSLNLAKKKHGPRLKGRIKVEAIIPAAGCGKRLKSKTLKPLIKIYGKPILVYTLSALAKSDLIQRIIIAVHPDGIDEFKRALRLYKINKEVLLVVGGETRKDSVNNCLSYINKDTDLILVHDAARPFLGQKLIIDTIKSARANRAALCAVPSKSTLKRVTDSREISETLDRENIWEIQTPQVFEKDALISAYKKYGHLEATDDASLVEKAGIRIKVVMGDYFNIKITTPEDLIFAQAILKTRNERSR